MLISGDRIIKGVEALVRERRTPDRGDRPEATATQ
jgi:hypothetical protein